MRRWRRHLVRARHDRHRAVCRGHVRHRDPDARGVPRRVHVPVGRVLVQRHRAVRQGVRPRLQRRLAARAAGPEQDVWADLGLHEVEHSRVRREGPHPLPARALVRRDDVAVAHALVQAPHHREQRGLREGDALFAEQRLGRDPEALRVQGGERRRGERRGGEARVDPSRREGGGGVRHSVTSSARRSIARVPNAHHSELRRGLYV